jgi:hypothetical protein
MFDVANRRRAGCSMRLPMPRDRLDVLRTTELSAPATAVQRLCDFATAYRPHCAFLAARWSAIVGSRITDRDTTKRKRLAAYGLDSK